MKKILITLLIFLIFILISGCQNENMQEEISLFKVEVKDLTSTIDDLVLQNNELIISVSDMKKTIIELKNEVDEANRNLAPTAVQDEITSLSDLEIDSIHQRVVKIFHWFQVGTMNTYCEKRIVVDNRTYCDVIGELTKYQELIDMMNSVLDYEIVESLLSSNRYIDVDGYIYQIVADRGTDIYKGEETSEIIRINEKKILYRVTVEVLDDEGKIADYEIHDFYLKYYTDGKWRFDEFYLFR